MTSLYDILKANRLGMDSDPWIAILGEAWKASEEEFKEYTGLVPYTFIANGQPLIDWYIKGNMQQAGTPVTVWYVLAEPETGIVNEPLRKIGDYVDTLTATQAGIEIPTDRGRNTIDIDTDIKPSEFYMKWKGR